MNAAHGTIALDGVVKRFGRTVVAVDDVSLRVEPGEIVTIVGPSGCGKTTMLRLIAGFERADAGRITISGHVVDDGRRVVPPERRHVGFVFQDYALFPHLTVGANIAFGLRGQLRDMLKAAGVTALIVTHEQEEALEIADRVLVLQRGRLEQIGTPQEVYATPASAFVAQFIGESNVVPGVVQDSGALTELGVVCCPPCFKAGCPVDVLLRPSQLCVEPDECAAAVLVSRAYAGTHATAVIRLPSGMEVRCASDASEPLQPGTRVQVRVQGCPTLVVAGAKQPEGAAASRPDGKRASLVAMADGLAGLDLRNGARTR